MILT
ncbi:AT-hook motif nuclear-localized protein 13 [Zea mays]|jgi:hypothetical protein